MYARISSGERAAKSTSVVSQKLIAASSLPTTEVKIETPECTRCLRPLRLDSITNACASSVGFSKIRLSNCSPVLNAFVLRKVEWVKRVGVAETEVEGAREVGVPMYDRNDILTAV